MKKMNIKPLFSKEETEELVKQYVGLSFETSDPINTEILKTKLYQRRLLGPEKTSMSFDEAYALGAYIVNLGRGFIPIADENRPVYRSRCLAVATSLQTAGLTPEEIAGICSAVFDYDIIEYVNPDAESVIDNCGMGGDNILTPNLSTVSLLAVSGYKNIRGCKHGSPGNTDSAGSSDFVKHILLEKKPSLEETVFKSGFFIDITTEEIADIIDKAGFCYTEALDKKYKTIHAQTHFLGKIAHINDILGPITNPVNPEKLNKRIVGINHLIKTRDVGEAYLIMNKKGVTNVKDAYLVRGKGIFGMDEFSNLPGGTEVTELKNGELKETFTVEAEDFGLKTLRNFKKEFVNGRYAVEGVSPPLSVKGSNFTGSQLKAEMSTKLLYDELEGPARDLILINMSPMLVLFGHAKDFRAGTELADQLLREKNGVKVIDKMLEELV